MKYAAIHDVLVTRTARLLCMAMCALCLTNCVYLPHPEHTANVHALPASPDSRLASNLGPEQCDLARAVLIEDPAKSNWQRFQGQMMKALPVSNQL